jgi:hypothetical protein
MGKGWENGASLKEKEEDKRDGAGESSCQWMDF